MSNAPVLGSDVDLENLISFERLNRQNAMYLRPNVVRGEIRGVYGLPTLRRMFAGPVGTWKSPITRRSIARNNIRRLTTHAVASLTAATPAAGTRRLIGRTMTHHAVIRSILEAVEDLAVNDRVRIKTSSRVHNIIIKKLSAQRYAIRFSSTRFVAVESGDLSDVETYIVTHFSSRGLASVEYRGRTTVRG